MFVSTWHIVNDRRLPNPPASLYRVEHSGNRNNVFSSRASPAFAHHDDFVRVKFQHANWSNRTPTPFLSTFSNYRHAYNHRRDTMGDYNVCIHEISSDGLLVFGAGGDEFLVLEEIPRTNIVETYEVSSDNENESSSEDDDYY